MGNIQKSQIGFLVKRVDLFAVRVKAKLFRSLTLLTFLLLSTVSVAASNHTFTTELQEVRTGSINGEEYLTIHIDSAVGPASCQGNVLRVDTQSLNQPGRQQAMESIALEAMLTSERVVITVPMNGGTCVDGMPTMTYINFVRSYNFY